MAPPTAENGKNGLTAAPFIDPEKWPEYLLDVLRSTRSDLASARSDMSELKEQMKNLVIRMDEFEHTFNGKVADAVRGAMEAHLDYHCKNEKNWGFRAWVKENPWRFAIIILLIGVGVGFVFGIPVKEVFSMYKEMKAAGLMK